MYQIITADVSYDSMKIRSYIENMQQENPLVHNQFTERWSSRDYDGTMLTSEEIDALLEAARRAPSSYNEQPWMFYYATSEHEAQKYLGLLYEDNRSWAKNAGFLCFLATRRRFTKTGEVNPHYSFDAGSAWMSLALQANEMGLSAHAMAGFDTEKAYEVLNINREEYEIITAIAVGKPTEDARNTEARTERNTLDTIRKVR